MTRILLILAAVLMGSAAQAHYASSKTSAKNVCGISFTIHCHGYVDHNTGHYMEWDASRSWIDTRFEERPILDQIDTCNRVKFQRDFCTKDQTATRFANYVKSLPKPKPDPMNSCPTDRAPKAHVDCFTPEISKWRGHSCLNKLGWSNWQRGTACGIIITAYVVGGSPR